MNTIKECRWHKIKLDLFLGMFLQNFNCPLDLKVNIVLIIM